MKKKEKAEKKAQENYQREVRKAREEKRREEERKKEARGGGGAATTGRGRVQEVGAVHRSGRRGHRREGGSSLQPRARGVLYRVPEEAEGVCD